jgi:hypothetical protein
MTTPAAARLYEAQHLYEMEGKKPVVYNPLNKPVDELPVIYGFNNGGSPGWKQAVLLAEDGHCLGAHICSSEAYMPHDLGILEGTRPDRHEEFKLHYPDGYRMEFISYNDLGGHEKFNKAIELNQKLAEQSTNKEGEKE